MEHSSDAKRPRVEHSVQNISTTVSSITTNSVLSKDTIHSDVSKKNDSMNRFQPGQRNTSTVGNLPQEYTSNYAHSHPNNPYNQGNASATGYNNKRHIHHQNFTHRGRGRGRGRGQGRGQFHGRQHPGGQHRTNVAKSYIDKYIFENPWEKQEKLMQLDPYHTVIAKAHAQNVKNDDTNVSSSSCSSA